MAIEFQVTPNNAKVTAFSDEKFQLTGDPVAGNKPGVFPKLVVEFQQNHPRFRVKLNNGERDQEARQIDFNLDVITVASLAEAIESMALKPEPSDIVFGVKRRVFDKAANKMGTPYIYGYIIAGKDADGCMYIGIQRGANETAKNYTRVKFNFVAPEFHPILDRATMQEAPRSNVSCLIARGWANMLKAYLPLIHANVWDYSKTEIGKWELKRMNNGGGNGYVNNNQGGGYKASNTASKPPVADQNFDDVDW